MAHEQAREQLRQRFGVGVSGPPAPSLADEVFTLETLFESPLKLARARVAAQRYANKSARSALADLADAVAGLEDGGGDAA